MTNEQKTGKWKQTIDCWTIDRTTVAENTLGNWNGWITYTNLPMTTPDRTKSWSELVVFENIGRSVHRLSSFSCLFIAASAKKQADVIVYNVKWNAMHSSSALALISKVKSFPEP